MWDESEEGCRAVFLAHCCLWVMASVPIFVFTKCSGRLKYIWEAGNRYMWRFESRVRTNWHQAALLQNLIVTPWQTEWSGTVTTFVRLWHFTLTYPCARTQYTNNLFYVVIYFLLWGVHIFKCVYTFTLETNESLWAPGASQIHFGCWKMGLGACLKLLMSKCGPASYCKFLATKQP